LDAPLDFDWVSSVETLLDSHFMDLESGEHLVVPDTVKIIFETDSIALVSTS
jgi:hypothetical protein